MERTQSEEGLLQVSLHLLPDALLHVVWTVALIALKHWHTGWRTVTMVTQQSRPGPAAGRTGPEPVSLTELLSTFLQVRDAPLGHDGDPGANVRPLPLHPGLVQNLSTEPQVNRVRTQL